MSPGARKCIQGVRLNDIEMKWEGFCLNKQNKILAQVVDKVICKGVIQQFKLVAYRAINDCPMAFSSSIERARALVVKGPGGQNNRNRAVVRANVIFWIRPPYFFTVYAPPLS